MSRVIDLSAQRRGGGPSEPLRHPAGVTLPFDGPSDAALIIPEIRSEIRSGAYDAEMIAQLDAALGPGDRVLVIGAGIGVLSTLIGRREEVERVITVEANTALMPYLERTHAMNGAERVETVNAVLAEGKKGRVPFFARRDLRTSSLLPHDRSWQQVMMVPFMDLNLILAEERITLIVSDIPVTSAELLARAELGRVERMLLSCADDPAGAWEDGGVCALLVARGYVPEAAGTAVLFRRADVLDKSEAKAPAGKEARDAARDAAADDTEPDDDTDDEELDEEDTVDALADGAEVRRETAAGPGAAEEPVGRVPEAPDVAAAPVAPPTPGEPAEPAAPAAGAGVQEPQGGTAPSAAGPARRRRRRRRGGGAAQAAREARAPDATAAQEIAPKVGANGGGRRRLWGLISVALFLALPLMLIGQLAGERGEARMEALERIGATWGGPQTLTGPFLLVPVQDADGGAAEPLMVLPDTLEAATRIETDGARGGAAASTPGALVYRSRSEVRLAADVAAASPLLGPGETALWNDTLLALGISEPAALGAVYLLGGEPRQSGFAPGSGAVGVPGIHTRIGDPRGQDQAWRFVLELDGWRTLRLTPAGGLTTWRLNGDWPHAEFGGAFRPALGEIGARGFVAEWQVPQAAHALPRAFRGTAPLAGLEAAALGVSLGQPLDLYRTVERAAKLGLLVIVLTFGAALLVERAAGREGRLAHYALIGAAQCAFFLLLLPLAEWIGFAVAYALAAAATSALLTAYAWSALRLGPRAGWMALALAALYAAIFPILVSDEHALLMSAVLAFLVVGALMWVTRGANGRSLGLRNST